MCAFVSLGCLLSQSTFSKNPYGKKREGGLNTHHESRVTMAPGIEANGGGQ